MPRARLRLAELLVFCWVFLRVFIVSENDLMNVIDQEVNNTDRFFFFFSFGVLGGKI